MVRGLAVFVALFALTVPLASGHVSPPGCAADHSLAMDMSGLNSVKRNGDKIAVAPTFGNTAANACDVTGGTVTVAFPNPDGSKGEKIVVATNVTLLAGQTKTFPAATHTVDFDDGVFRGFVWIELEGVWHATDPDPPFGSVGALGRPLVISRPHVTFTVTPTPSGPPFVLDFMYTVENDSPQDPAGEMSNPTPGVVSALVKDSGCSPVTFTGGDTSPSQPPIIDLGETWTYTCSKPFAAGSVLDIVTFTGGSTRDGRPWPGWTVRKAYCGRLPATIVGSEKANTIVGTPGQDVILGRGGNDLIKGMGGDDVICAGDGKDVVRGGAGDDVIRGERGDDTLFGDLGTDTLVGGAGRNALHQ